MQKSKKISVRISEEQFEWLENQAKQKNTNISEIICELIDKKRIGFFKWLRVWLKRF